METRLQRRDYLASCNWAAIDTDILCSIFTRLPYVDLLRVNSTCWGWNAAIDVFKRFSPASSIQKIPWLIFTPVEDDEVVVEGEKNGRFMNVEGKKIYPFNDLAAKKMNDGCYCIGSSHDWLICVDNQAIPYLVNPFTSCRIDLPPLDSSLCVERVCETGNRCCNQLVSHRVHFVRKAVLSSSPSLENNYYLVMIYGGNFRGLACCKDGETSWTKLDGEHYHDIIFHENQLYGFYSTDHLKYNHLRVWDMNQDGFNLVNTIDIVNKELESGLQDHGFFWSQFYLVESQGSLLAARKDCKYAYNKERFSKYGSEINDWQIRFSIFKLDMEQKLWRGVVSLCGFALFLGTNQSISIDVRNCKILKQDSIYFTDEVGHRTGVFSFKDNCVDWLDGTKRGKQRSTPTWVVPRLK